MKDLEMIFNYTFKDQKALEQALSHKSYVNEKRIGKDNEKLEFIGDAVLGLALAESLFQLFPDDEEGDLSKKRASLVNEVVLSEMAHEAGIPRYLKLGRGESLSGGEARPRLLASALEAIVGAIFLEAGFDQAKAVVTKLFEKRLKDEKLNLNYEQDFKSRLQEILQKTHKETPTYQILNESGLPHNRVFKVEVSIKGRALASAEGRSKKEAEQKAAQLALVKEGCE